jgi:AraC-like DNA-binding protein
VGYRRHVPRLASAAHAHVVASCVDAFWFYDGIGVPHRVLPDGCMDIVFDLATGRTRAVGAMSRADTVCVAEGERLFGVRFRPGRAALFFDVKAGELLDLGAPLDAVLGPRAALLAERVAEARTDDARALAVAELVCDRGARVRAIDARVDRAATLLERSRGLATIPAVASAVSVSTRQLERLFDDRVGVGPKVFARVLKMQTAVRLLEQRHTPGAHIAALAGYADQPHLVRELRALCGVSPSALRPVDQAVSVARGLSRRS